MKTVRIAELKARLSEYLRAVRRGETIAVLDRETPRRGDRAGQATQCLADPQAGRRRARAESRAAAEAVEVED